MEVRFLSDYRGVLTGEIFYPAGAVASVDAANAQQLVAAGRAELAGATKPASASKTALDEDFPGRAALARAGIEFVEDVPLDAGALTALRGIGRKTADEILVALDH